MAIFRLMIHFISNEDIIKEGRIKFNLNGWVHFLDILVWVIFKTLRIVWKLKLVLHINITALYLKKIICSTLKRLILTQPVTKVGIKLQEITLCPFQYGRIKPNFDLLPRTWRYNNRGKWFLVVNKLYYTLLVDYTPFATVYTHFK